LGWRSNVSGEDRITVHDELGFSSEKAVLSVEQIADRLHHPRTGRLMRDATNLDATAGKIDDD
jgi:hypothetical protein